MKKKKILKFLLWSFVSLLTLVALLYAWIDWSGNLAWKNVEAELLAKGEPLRLEQIIPPAVPNEQNFAFSPFFEGVFETKVSTENGRVIHRPKNPEASARLHALSLPGNPNQPKVNRRLEGAPWDLSAWQTYFRAHAEFRLGGNVRSPAIDIVEALGNWKAPLDKIAGDLRTRPQMRAPLSYEHGFAMNVPHVFGVSHVAKLFQIRAIAHIRQGRPSEAFSDLESLLLLRKALEPRQLIIGGLMADSITKHALIVIREGLAAHTWDEDQLSRLSLRLELLTPLADLSSALRFERVGFIYGTRQFMSDNLQTKAIIEGGMHSRWSNGLVEAIVHLPNGYWEQDRAVYSRSIQQHLEKVLIPRQERLDVSAHRGYEAHLATLLTSRMRHILSSIALPAVSNLGIKSAEMSANISQARIAIAVERYRAMNSSLPENLAALAPEFIARIPHDPIDGQPLRYQKLSTTNYRIWSIGYDEKDGGGVPGAAGVTGTEGDWVWESLPPQ
jgi:hypothetical protein